ncbi:MAG: IS66 family transposase [Acidobacteriales bacterium]|nr:IS66 family transposase [Terriglobales bacterium]
MRTPRRRIDVNLEELDQIIECGTHAPLSESDGQKLKAALHAMADRLSANRSTEKTRAVLKESQALAPAQRPENAQSRPEGHGRNSAAQFTGAPKINVPHATLTPGLTCPECLRGKIYQQKQPATLVRIVGRPPLEATVFELQRLRCNACGQIFTAEAPQAAGAKKYDDTAIAMLALLKYGTGIPFSRLERLQHQLGMPLPAATQWELLEAAAQEFRPAWKELIRQGAQGGVVHNDDTGMRILHLAREPGDKRTGTFTSGIVSILDGRNIALFFTGSRHAGENLAEVLKHRARGLAPPVQMCDALARNTPKLPGMKPLLANCLAHGRRQFIELVENFPQECRYVLEILRGVYHNDELAREKNLSAEERLHFHQQRSRPLMKALREWMETQFAERRTEPNSGLGKAISYLLNHWAKLTLFLGHPGVPLDNNIVERALKKAILNRKNALFYKTRNGAAVGDLFMSLIHTCELNGANPSEYLTELHRHAADLSRFPAAWMPWNYREALAQVAA